jgi:hypothetical protein
MRIRRQDRFNNHFQIAMSMAGDDEFHFSNTRFAGTKYWKLATTNGARLINFPSLYHRDKKELVLTIATRNNANFCPSAAA